MRGILPDEQIDATLAALRSKRELFIAQQLISGGVDLDADPVNIDGDAVGRDKIEQHTASTQYIATNMGSGAGPQGRVLSVPVNVASRWGQRE